MRLLFVHQNLGAFGGAETNIKLTASELRQRGHVLGLVYARETGRDKDDWRRTFPACFRLPERASASLIRAALARFAPDLIYLHTLADLETLGTLVESGLPIVRMVHDHEMYCMRGYKYNYFTRRICNRPVSWRCVFPCLAPLARNRESGFPIKWASFTRKREEIRLNLKCDLFVVYSEYSRQELVRNGFPPEKIRIHVPIRCWGLDGRVSSLSDRNLVLYVGQVIRGKGVDLLLRALAKVKVPFECVILGEGNHRASCERLCRKLGLASRVTFRGFAPREELENYYLEASLLAVSSVWPEPFGMVGPEAMRYGLPVVAFDAGGVREWLSDGENGFLVPWMDATQFAEKIDLVLSNKDLARSLGRRGLERVNRLYDASFQVSQLEQVFARLLAAAAHGASGRILEKIFPKPDHQRHPDATAISTLDAQKV